MKLFIGFWTMILCWIASCILGICLFGAGLGLGFDSSLAMISVLIGWIVFNVKDLVEPEYKTWFNIWMGLIYIPTLLSVL